MSSEWTSCLLENVLEVKYGKDHKKLGQGAIPVYGSGGVMRYADAALYDDESILIPRKGSLNNVLFENKPFWTVDTMFWSKINKTRAFPKFLYYQLSVIDFMSISIGSAVPSMTVPVLNALEITLPPLHEQRAIADVLSALDDRITLLRETNATLEAIAQALFKSWFVDFDPVRAKLEGRTPEGMDVATAALFPDGFEESELGLVPKDWRVGTLADLSHLNPESWTAKNHPESVTYVDLANAKDNEIASVTDFDFDEAPSRARRVLRGGDTIVGTVRPGNRSFAFIHEPASNLTASTGFAVLRPSAIENTEFVYLAATQDSSIEHLAHVADGGAYPAVRPDVVSGLQIVVPDVQVLKAFHAVAVSLLAKVSENQKQAQTLATLRDTLLPRLISGALRLPETL